MNPYCRHICKTGRACATKAENLAAAERLPLASMGLSTRPLLVLQAMELECVGDVVLAGRRAIEDAPRCGRVYADEIQAAVERLGLALPLDPPQELL